MLISGDGINFCSKEKVKFCGGLGDFLFVFVFKNLRKVKGFAGEVEKL